MFHHRSSAPEKKAARNKSTGPASKKAELRGSVKKNISSESSKQDRLNHLKQLRQGKKEEIMERRRLGTGGTSRQPPPKIVALIACHTQADTLSLKRQIFQACGGSAELAATLAPHVPVPGVMPPYAQGPPGSGKARVLLVDPPRDVVAVLDVAKCADVVVCVMGPHASLEEPAFDDTGYRLLSALKAQGLPTVVGAVHGATSAMLSAKRSADAKKFVSRYFTTELGADAKLFHSSTDEEVKALVRGLGCVTPKDVSWRSDRGYMLAQDATYVSSEGMLCLKGYVRGAGFSCKNLVHLTGHGDFAIAKLEAIPDPCSATPERHGSASSGVPVSDVATPDLEIDWERLQPYDPTTAEQTWPTDEEMGDMPPPRGLPKAAAARRREAAGKIRAPENSADDAEGGAGDASMEDDGEGSDDGSVAAPSLAPSGLETDDGWDVSSNMTMDVPNSEIVAAERKRREEFVERSVEDREFPDEVDFPLDIAARERFQKYRGLKSFRTSAWDPYEELPVEYSRIWEFEAFGATGRAVRQQYYDDCNELGNGDGTVSLYCAVYLKAVQPTVFENQPRGVPFVLSGLFPCEQKVSVVHAQLQRVAEYQEVMKSKQEVSLHCGFRRFPARPIFSEIPKKSSPCKKYKFMRFLHQEVTACASFYAPVVFPPCRLLMLTHPSQGTQPELTAVGSITGVDPKQLIIKRSILTGYPFRTHKSKAVVRFMFFNPNDVRWFKPVELVTKKGLRGHISESLGTHGYMKCRFSGPIKQDDTVCMHLYKRIYPKWYPPSWGGDINDAPDKV